MSDLFKSGSIIPLGYTVSVTTWENDGDDYTYQHIKGINNIELVKQFIFLLGWFSGSAADMGGGDMQHEEILTRLFDNYKDGKFSTEFIERFIDGKKLPELNCTDEEFEDWLDSCATDGVFTDIEEELHCLLGYPVNYDENYARVVSEVSVFYFEEEFIVPAAPEPIKKFSGKWNKDSIYECWQL